MWLVIGYGSLLNGDDRFGRVVAEELQDRVPNKEAEVISIDQLNPELIEAISKADGVIFVDASVNLSAGELECVQLAESGSQQVSASPIFSHHSKPESLIQAAAALYGHAPPSWLYAVGGEEFGWGEDLSAKIKKMVPEVVELILNHVCDRSDRSQTVMK